MSWIAELDTQGREFPTCVHVTKTTNTMIHGATYVPIEEGKAVRAENAKLREELSKWERLVAGIDLPEYPVTQFKPKDLERENAKLRELVRDYLIFYSQPGCTYCFCHDECRESEEPCIAFERLVDRTNELGIEVPR